MRLVSEHRSAGHRDTERVVQLFTGGIRVVTQGDREWWSRYIIIPRRLMLNRQARGCVAIVDRRWGYGRLVLSRRFCN